MTVHAQPVGGPMLTRGFRYLVLLTGLGAALVIWRFSVGLGAVSAMSDGYPWGLWIAFDVVTGTALACGGYAMAILIYILNKNRYHPLIRPAILTSALGYTLGGLAVAVDVGRPWGMWRIPVRFWNWNLSSVQLEVALCIMAYTAVLWIEMAPAFMEKWQESTRPGLRKFAKRMTIILEKSFIWIAALGILLPTMHQSSLGTMMLLTGHKLHPLWNTPMVPLLFLASCIAMGYAVVVFESALSSRAFKREPETAMLSSLGGVVPITLLFFLAVRFIDMGWRGRLPLAFAMDLPAIMFWAESLLFLAPALLLMSARRRNDLGALFRAALLVMVAGALFRFNLYLIAFNPGPQWSYFPSVVEILITVGIVALEVCLYIFIVRRFPILGGIRPAGTAE
jgi:Ni/Fe-hydrogenase subunit HybB-like protein